MPDKTALEKPARVTLSYSIRVAPDDRIYWVGAFVDGREELSDAVAPGLHDLEVEVHILPLAGVGARQLYRLRKQVQITVLPDRRMSFSVDVRRTNASDPDRAFVMLVRGQPSKEEPASSAPHSSRALTPPTVIKGGVIPAGAISPPGELMDLRPWVVLTRVCVEDSGRVDSIAPLVRMHPRDLAAVIDWVLRQKHVPYRINGAPAPFCYPLHFEIRRG